MSLTMIISLMSSTMPSIHQANPSNWPLFHRISERHRSQVDWCAYWHDRIYAHLVSDRVLAAGLNHLGLLGVGDDRPVAEAQEIVELRGKQIVDIVPRRDFVAALSRSGLVYTWGDNDWAQLGTGTIGGPRQLKPLIVAGLTEIASIKCGQWHTLALDVRGRVFVWGANTHGQIGNGRRSAQRQPLQLSFGADKVIAIACGMDQSFVATCSGEVYGWGRVMSTFNRPYGQASVPIKLDVCGQRIKDIAVGGFNNLFLNEDGQLFYSDIKSTLVESEEPEESNDEDVVSQGSGTGLGFKPRRPSKIKDEIIFKPIASGVARFTSIYCLESGHLNPTMTNTKLFLMLSTNNVVYVIGPSCKGPIELSLTEAIVEYSFYRMAPFLIHFRAEDQEVIADVSPPNNNNTQHQQQQNNVLCSHCTLL